MNEHEDPGKHRRASGAPATTLRELDASDIATLNGWRRDPELVALLGGPFRHVALPVDERWYESYLGSRSNNVRLAIVAGDSVVGAVYLLNIDWIARSGEFSIWIGDRRSRGCGVGSHAARSMLQHAFGDLNLQRVYLAVLTGNSEAIRLYRRLGFVEEGIQRRAAFKRGKYEDLLLMAKLRDASNPTGGELPA